MGPGKGTDSFWGGRGGVDVNQHWRPALPWLPGHLSGSGGPCPHGETCVVSALCYNTDLWHRLCILQRRTQDLASHHSTVTTSKDQLKNISLGSTGLITTATCGFSVD